MKTRSWFVNFRYNKLIQKFPEFVIKTADFRFRSIKYVSVKWRSILIILTKNIDCPFLSVCWNVFFWRRKAVSEQDQTCKNWYEFELAPSLWPWILGLGIQLDWQKSQKILYFPKWSALEFAILVNGFGE